MRRLVKSAVTTAARHPCLWGLIETSLGRIVNLGRHALRQDQLAHEHTVYVDRIIRYLGPEPVVIAGPFAGMRYPRMASAGSALAPKLLGTYELELATTVDQIIRADYERIVDVGSAEGYYAVGLAMHHEDATIFAFDIDPTARQACHELATINGVSDRTHIQGICSPERLLSLDLGNRALIWADCEGYERTLFTPEVIVALRRHDVVIELHDAIDLGISLHLTAAFEGSHRVELIDSIDDIRKTYTYDVPVLEGAPLEDRHALLAESRGGQMQWLVAWSRVAAG